jgi:23S rRNA U2552 (ribose-2'-O)-methylase RlmE/FtsJ
MVLNNKIIYNNSLSDNILQLNEKLKKKFDKYIKLTDKILSFSDNNNYDNIINLDKYNIIKDNIILYNPIEYNGWFSLVDLIYYKFKNVDSMKILIDSNIYGVIELLKYMREKDDIFYISSRIIDDMNTKEYEYLKKMFNINIVDINNEEILKEYHFNLIIISNIDMIKYYNNILYDGYIINLIQIIELSDNLINKLNKSLKLFNYIELISPTIIKNTGEFIILLSNKKIDKIKKKSSNLMLKLENFFKFHLQRIIKINKSKLYILEVSNDDIQNKLISTYYKKIKNEIINLMIQYNIPINTKILEYYDNKMITINNKLYSSINLLSYQFINYETIKLELCKINTKFDNLNKIALNLNQIKRAIDTRNFKKWQYTTYQLDNFKSLGSYINNNYDVVNNKNYEISNAFLKMYELITTYPLINSNKLKSFHFCEAPGMFIIALNHYINTKTNITDWEWYGNSLTIEESKTALTDYYNLIKNNQNKWLNGDIRTNIDNFKKQLNEVDLITSDCGICVEPHEYNKYEEKISDIEFAQFYNLLNLLKKGGSGILKTFIPLELASNVCIIYLLTNVFEKVYLSKPITSRPSNSEVYLVCINYYGINQHLLDELKKLLYNYDPNIQWIKNIPDSFIKQLEDYIIDITRQQISYLLNIFYFIDNDNELHKLKIISSNKLKEENNKYWIDKFKFESNNKNKLI